MPPQIEEARGEFDEIDTNSDGFIDREEIAAMPEAPEDEELEEFFGPKMTQETKRDFAPD